MLLYVLALTTQLPAQEDVDFPGWFVELEHQGQTTKTTWRGNTIDFSTIRDHAYLESKLDRIVAKSLLESEGKGEYEFAIRFRGEVEVKLGEVELFRSASADERVLHSPKIALEDETRPLSIILKQTTEIPNPVVSIFWKTDRFDWEPIPLQRLVHTSIAYEDSQRRRTRFTEELASLGCANCHQELRVPLDLPRREIRLGDLGVESSWLTTRLRDTEAAVVQLQENDSLQSRRMPYFQLNDEEIGDLTKLLLASSPTEVTELESLQKRLRTAVDQLRKSVKEKNTNLSEVAKSRGEEILVGNGCLQCHSWKGLGRSDQLGGGDLTQINEKRSAISLFDWLATGEVSHRPIGRRMPEIGLSDADALAVAYFLAGVDSGIESLSEKRADSNIEKLSDEERQRGRAVLVKYGCLNCHVANGNETEPQAIPLVNSTAEPNGSILHNWGNACLNQKEDRAGKSQPIYQLNSEQAAELIEFAKTIYKKPTQAKIDSAPKVLPRVLEERRAVSAVHQFRVSLCANCHARNEWSGGREIATRVVENRPDERDLLPRRLAPTLTSVGDKLLPGEYERILAKGESRVRPWLSIQMPTYPKVAVDSVRDYFEKHDRNITASPKVELKLSETEKKLLGARLVTANGLGCTSCHSIGEVKQSQAPVHTLGPNLLGLNQRVRREWFDRWVRNPARIVPGMEMPSIQLGVQGVLDGKLPEQLELLWDVLGDKNFVPPPPDAVRIVRRHFYADQTEAAAVLTDVFRVDGRALIKPLVIGLPNRWNAMLDLERPGLVRVWLGDTARQRTEGKSWYWEVGGTVVLQSDSSEPEFYLERNGARLSPISIGQFPADLLGWSHDEQNQSLKIRYRLRFAAEGEAARDLEVSETWRASELDDSTKSGIHRRIRVAGLLPGEKIRFQQRLRAYTNDVLAEANLKKGKENLPIDSSGGLTSEADEGSAVWDIEYTVNMLPDKVVDVSIPKVEYPITNVNSVPGFVGTRLPIGMDWMPTGFAFGERGEMYVASLKGEVWRAVDTNGDGVEDSVNVVSDDLAAPYGLASATDGLFVVNKFGLLKLSEPNSSGVFQRSKIVAGGWGHTADYHDWAVGLPKDREGNLYIALPCQQDKRSEAAATLRGTVLKLKPNSKGSGADQEDTDFTTEVLTTGHRFPMGIALSSNWGLFVTDNQGNYNPFNELNHVVSGKYFGFVNALDKEKPKPPLESPAINIPHPWTRSVNGITFLELPGGDGNSVSPFGPFAGDLIGCEYDTRRLIRMSLQEVDGVIQGAAYPFSSPDPDPDLDFLGPVSIAISPTGEIVVGDLRDSGWGGANNIGAVVKLRLDQEKLPCGIDQIEAVHDGFVIRFTKQVDVDKGADKSNYRIESYTRTSTPEYGGADQQRRTEKIVGVDLRDDLKSVHIKLSEMRAGFVYEFGLKSLTNEPNFFPVEGHYTLKNVPKTAAKEK